MRARTNPAKPGMSVTVVWDLRAQLIPNFVDNYSYLVRFDTPGSVAGNHYHLEKHEIYAAAHGTFKIIIENIETKEREELILTASDNSLLYVTPPYAHTVVANTPDAVLLVAASSPDIESDVFAYKLI